MTLRDRIRELANERGMSLPNLELKLGFGNGTIVKWDKASPNTDKLQKVADYFGVSIDYLLGRTDPFENIDSETRSLARDISGLESNNKFLLRKMIDTMKEVGKEAKGE